MKLNRLDLIVLSKIAEGLEAKGTPADIEQARDIRESVTKQLKRQRPMHHTNCGGLLIIDPPTGKVRCNKCQAFIAYPKR